MPFKNANANSEYLIFERSVGGSNPVKACIVAVVHSEDIGANLVPNGLRAVRPALGSSRQTELCSWPQPLSDQALCDVLTKKIENHGGCALGFRAAFSQAMSIDPLLQHTSQDKK
jgi:hypothetical protein